MYTEIKLGLLLVIAQHMLLALFALTDTEPFLNQHTEQNANSFKPPKIQRRLYPFKIRVQKTKSFLVLGGKGQRPRQAWALLWQAPAREGGITIPHVSSLTSR